MFSGLKMKYEQLMQINKETKNAVLKGKQITRFQSKILNHCISNRLKHPLLNSYFDNLAICRADLGGNDVGHNFGSTRRSVLLSPNTLPQLRECSYRSLCN